MVLCVFFYWNIYYEMYDVSQFKAKEANKSQLLKEEEKRAELNGRKAWSQSRVLTHC